MSTLRVTNVQDTAGANSSTSAEIFSGRAKAWVNFNGTGTVAIRANYNVSSITDNATGDYTVNFSSALTDASYCALCMTEGLNGNTEAYPLLTQDRAQTSSNVSIYFHQGGVGNEDKTRCMVAIFR